MKAVCFTPSDLDRELKSAGFNMEGADTGSALKAVHFARQVAVQVLAPDVSFVKK